MAFILSAQRRPSGAVIPNFRRYQEYLVANRSRFPRHAYELATSDWYHHPSDHRCPHDAWLESAIFEEPATGDRNEIRTATLRVRLLGSYHDGHIELTYPQVFRYELLGAALGGGHADWLWDEFRLSDGGHVLHEIEWASESRWLIEASDVQCTWQPRPGAG
jgi:hypothetical protein